MFFFTSDLHLGHVPIINLCNRPFASVEEMNETLIQNWNQKVHGDDTVYVLGDLFFRTHDDVAITSMLKRLKGRKHLFIGNHDADWLKIVHPDCYFETVNTYQEEPVGSFGYISFCHYPMLSWNHQQTRFMIHGHVHNNPSPDAWQFLKTHERILNACVDINGFAPVSFDELVENNRRWKEGGGN